MLTFDELAHTYRIHGSVVPSVTQVLDDMGLIPEYPEKEIYRRRGTAVHKACALLARGRLNWGTTDPRIHGYIRSYERWLERTNFFPELIEQPVCSVNFQVAGTLDVFGGGLLCDLKSGEPPEASRLQTAGYAILLKEHLGASAVRRMTLRLDRDGDNPTPDEHTNHSEDHRLFMAAVALWHFRKNHGLL